MSARPSLVAALLSTALLAWQFSSGARADILPIRRGYYVLEEVPCGQASNATLRLYDGVSFGQAHMECKAPSSKHLASGPFQITSQCRDTEGRGGPWKKLISTYKILGETKFVALSEPTQGTFRYCRQSDLPSPWDLNDLSTIGVSR